MIGDQPEEKNKDAKQVPVRGSDDDAVQAADTDLRDPAAAWRRRHHDDDQQQELRRVRLDEIRGQSQAHEQHGGDHEPDRPEDDREQADIEERSLPLADEELHTGVKTIDLAADEGHEPCGLR